MRNMLTIPQLNIQKWTLFSYQPIIAVGLKSNNSVNPIYLILWTPPTCFLIQLNDGQSCPYQSKFNYLDLMIN